MHPKGLLSQLQFTMADCVTNCYKCSYIVIFMKSMNWPMWITHPHSVLQIGCLNCMKINIVVLRLTKGRMEHNKFLCLEGGWKLLHWMLQCSHGNKQVFYRHFRSGRSLSSNHSICRKNPCFDYLIFSASLFMLIMKFWFVWRESSCCSL